MWILWALLSAILAASRRTSQKRLANKLNPFTIGFAVQLLALPIITLAMVLNGSIYNPLDLGVRFWLPLLIISFGFYPLNSYLSVHAIKDDELSKVLPLQSLWPVFSLLPAWLMLGEVPSVLATVGIALTVLGVYVLGLKGKALHHPLQPFREEKGSRYMLFAVILVTIAGVLDKIAIQASNATYYSFASTVGAVIVLALTLKLYIVRERTIFFQNFRELVYVGTFQGASYTTYLLSLAAGPIAYVSAIRGSNVLMGSMLGVWLLGEKLTKPKILSFVLICIGGIQLAIGS